MTHPVDTPRYRSELSQDAVQAEREKIADWLDESAKIHRDLAKDDRLSFETKELLASQAEIIELYSPRIRSGAYQAASTPREKLKGEKG